MAFQPFINTLATLREVRIPPELTDDKRADFIKRIRTAVSKQAAAAESSDAILRLTGKVGETGDVLRIEHEPAAPFDLNSIVESDEHPDIQTLWWFTNAVLNGLAEVEPKRLVHGGLQPRSMLLDRVGRVKLTDFGVASAFEAACGREERRRLACDIATADQLTEGGVSGVWEWLDENSERVNSWIAPFFSPEVLAGGILLNQNSDQFSLGVLLYMLAAGVHPLGAELSNPELFGYFVPEPYPFEEEREDWAEAIERQEADTALSDDRPVLDWAALVYRLLGNEPGERYANFTVARDEARKHAPDQWGEALRVLGESVDLLAQEQYGPFLTNIGPWSENEALPAVWRDCLVECIAGVENAKAEHAARTAVEARLSEGRAALEGGNLEQARVVVAELAAALTEGDPLLEGVDELERECGEYERNIQEKAEELFQANYTLAEEALVRAEFTEARMILAGLLDDPLTSEAHSKKIEVMLATIEATSRKHADFHENLDAAKAEHGEGALSAALERLEKLLADDDLPEQLRAEAESFARELESERRRHEEHLAIINDVEQALLVADLATAEENLAMLPFDTQDPFIIERRDELTASCERLRGVIERKNSIEVQLNHGEAEAAHQAATNMLEEELPDALREQLSDLSQRSQTVIEQAQKARIGDALESLAHAETALQGGDIQQCRQLLSLVLSMSSRFEPDDRQRVARLDAAVADCEKGLRRIETAERRLGQQEFAAADTELGAIDEQAMPNACLEQIAALREQIGQAREAHRAQRLRRLNEWLEQVADHLKNNDIDAAEELLNKDAPPEDADAELLQRYEQLREDTRRGRQILKSLADVEDALREQQLDSATDLLNQLEQSLDAPPQWALERMAQARARLEDVVQARREKAVREVEQALEQAAAALETTDIEEARRRLALVENGVDLDEPLRERREKLTQAVAELEQWLPQLAECETALQQNDLKQARLQCAGLLKKSSIPAPVQRRLHTIEAAAEEKIGARRATLLKQLAELEDELRQRGRRVKTFLKRVEAVQQDPLAAAEHKNKAAKLIEQYEAAPKPRGRGVPIALSAAAIVIVVGGAGWYFTRGDGQNPSQSSVQSPSTEAPDTRPDVSPEPIAPSADELISAALAGIQQAFTQIAASLPADRTTTDWELYFEPADAFTATLHARDESGRTLTLASDVAENEIADLEWNPAWEELLFPPARTAEAAPPDPDAAPVETSTTEPVWPDLLATGVIEQPRRTLLRDLFQALAPAEALVDVRPPLSVLANLLARIEVGERDENNTVALQLVLMHDSGAVTDNFAMRIRGDAWLPAAENAGALKSMLEQVVSTLTTRQTALADRIEQHYLSGELTAAYQVYAQAQDTPGSSELDQLDEPTSRITRIRDRLPPPWDSPAGYTPGEETAPGLGYPASLTRDGRTLLLVNIPPGDPLWNELSAAAANAPLAQDAAGYELVRESAAAPFERPWRLFYIDARDPEQTVDADPRDFASRSLGGELPSLEHWQLAALKLRADPASSGFFNGRWEWCAKGAQLWVCGGCAQLHGQYLPPPNDAQRFDELWAWINHPLVSQPRLRGDNLAGVRSVLLP